MDEADVSARLNNAVATFLERDRHLLENSLSERCIASRLAMYLQAQFPEHSVDVQYNRKGGDAKMLELPEECENYRDEDGFSLVVPDVIVHQRGADGPNILVLEVKKRRTRWGTRATAPVSSRFAGKCITNLARSSNARRDETGQPAFRVSEWFAG